jgi:crossover junction endodeoxyribonuclease RusA
VSAQDPGAADHVILIIPAPAPWLSANQRVDLRRQTPDRRAWRDAGHLYAKQAALPKLQRVHIIATLRFRDARRRDPHNYYPTLKALVDGLVDYGLIPDDDDKHLIGPDIRLGQVMQAPGLGEVWLDITDLDANGVRTTCSNSNCTCRRYTKEGPS